MSNLSLFFCPLSLSPSPYPLPTNTHVHMYIKCILFQDDQLIMKLSQKTSFRSNFPSRKPNLERLDLRNGQDYHDASTQNKGEEF